MFVQAAEQLVLSQDVTAYTRAIDMGGANAVEVQAELISAVSAPTCVVKMAQGNDGQNWSAEQDVLDFDAIGTKRARLASIGARFVRIRALLSAGTTAVLAIGVNTADD